MKNNIPENIDDLFINRDNEYQMYTNEYLDNYQSMSLFIEELQLQDLIINNEGTQIQLKHCDFPYTLQIDAVGLGYFYSHKFIVSILEWEDETEEESLYI